MAPALTDTCNDRAGRLRVSRRGAASSPQPSPARGREKNSSPLTPHKPASQRKMFAFAGPWLDVLENGYILFIDELHYNLHPRSGIAMAMLGLILVAIVFSRHLGGGGSFGLMGRLIILVIGFTLALGLAPVLDRFAWGDMEGDARWRVAGATLDRGPTRRSFPSTNRSSWASGSSTTPITIIWKCFTRPASPAGC